MVFILLLFVLSLVTLFIGHRRASLSLTLNIAFFPLILLWFGNDYRQYRGWKRIEQRRLAAVAGDTALLAEEQPAPNPAALTLPATTTFQVNVNKVQKAFFLICIALTGLVSSVSISLSTGIPFSWAILIGGTVLLLLIMLLSISSIKTTQVLEITEIGLIMQAPPEPGFTGRVTWDEARLFAVYSSPSELKSEPTLIYELSGASNIVRWRTIAGPGVFGARRDRGMSLTEHDQMMQALRQLIVAKTGLPLYDLRKEQAMEMREGILQI